MAKKVKKAPPKKKTSSGAKKASPVEVLSSTPDESDESIDTPVAIEPEILLPEDVENLERDVPDDKALAPTDPIARYMSEVRRYPVLSRAEEFDVATRYRETGDPELAQVLVTSNLRFVVKVAAEYSKFGAKLIDLIQEGNVGLMHAVKEFNPTKGVRLISYAVWWIRGYIQEYLMRQYSMVRIGTTQNQRKLFYQLQKHAAELERMGFREGVAQLSGRLGVSEGEVIDMSRRMMGRDVSLDQPLRTNDSTSSSTLLDLQSGATGEDAGADEEIGRREELLLLEDRLADLRPQLSEKELILLDQRLLADDPLTLQEIGERYGTTREAVRQMEARLLQKIKNAMMKELGEG